MDTNVSSGSSNADSVLFNYATQQQEVDDSQETTVNLKTGNKVFTDSTDKSDSSNTFQRDFFGIASRPALPVPSPDAPPVNGKQLLELYQSGSAYMNLLVSNTNSKSSSTLPSSAQQFVADCEQINVTDPQIIALAQKEGEPPGLIYKQVQYSANALFEQQLDNLPTGMLPENAASMLRYAYGNPQAAASLPPELQALLKTMTAQVNAQIATQYGFSNTWQGIPPSNTFLNAEISEKNDGGFQTLVNQYAQVNGLTDTQSAELMAMHFMPGTQTSDPALQGIFNQLEQQNTASMQATYGPGFVSQPDTGYFTQMLNGAFCQFFQDALKKQDPPLSSADQASIIALYANPNDPSVSADDKARLTPLLQSITASSTAQVSAQFGLDALGVKWAPVVTSINNPNVDPVFISKAQAGLSMANEVLAKANAFVDQLPSPQKETYKDFLKAISNSILQYQQFLYTLQGSQAAVSNRMTSVSYDQQTSALQKQQDALKAQEDQEKHQGKGVNMPSWLSDITTWVNNIVAAVMIMPPFLGAFYLVDKIVAAATGKPSLVDKMFKAITSEMSKTPIGAALAPYVTMVMCVALTSTSPLACIQMMTSDSQSIQGIVATMGGNAEAQQITAMVLTMVVTIAFTIAVAVMSGGADAAFVVEEMTETIAETLNVTTKTVETVAKVTQVVLTLYSITTAVLQGTSNIIQGVNEINQSKITLQQGEADAYSAMVDGLIKAIKKLITLLQQQMSSTGTQIVDLSSLLKTFMDTNAQMVTDITSSQGA